MLMEKVAQVFACLLVSAFIMHCDAFNWSELMIYLSVITCLK